ncbi:hypothetical protein SAMN04488056_103206 [Cohaesibacter marisflavi]|uniref:LTXXQ motif family protein n=1 Tax=Cohaesibacter marisflavi TaxID=655353 RepID=A0A1I5EIY8_9HYPH|nr:hypothetical protein [Cohaesibacter marisflavi]SFO11492.1 hypothetical protein SAMN04488056_103206 [Cohaesibacter marisflavi]
MPFSHHVPTICFGAFFAVLIPIEAMTAGMVEQEKRSKYAGQQERTIKSLSQDDIDELKKGGGWGLAKAAELNGFPGPAHLLDLKDKLVLDDEQVEKLETLYEQMTSDARKEAKTYIFLEAKLEKEFSAGRINDGLLRTALGYIEESRRKLRYIHLSAHLEATKIVTPEQVEHYNALRGYSEESDVCASVPEGHDAAMWRKHNGCGEN